MYGKKTHGYKKVVLFTIVYLLGPSLSTDAGSATSAPAEDDGPPGPDDTNGEATTEVTPAYEKPTDIPQSDIDDALFLEVGEYSTISFAYYNDRFLGWHKKKPDGYVCHDDYVRCVLSQTLRHPVCVVHKIDQGRSGLRNLPTVCDMHHYNCRRGYRYWYIMKYGVCSYLDWEGMIVLEKPITY